MFMSEGWSMGFGHGFGMLFWLILFIAIIWLLVKAFSRRQVDRSEVHKILAERFARGEINEQEYQHKLDLLTREEK